MTTTGIDGIRGLAQDRGSAEQPGTKPPRNRTPESGVKPGHDEVRYSGGFAARRLQFQLAASLERHLGFRPSEAEGPSEGQGSSTFDVARNILASVREALDAGRTEGRGTAELEQLLAAVRTDLEQTFDELRGLLERFGDAPNAGPSLKGIYRQVQLGLDGLERELRSDAVAPNVSDPGGARRAERTAGQELRRADVQRSRSFSLDVRTRDGDVARITLSRERRVSLIDAVNSAVGGRQDALALRFSVEGNLDAAERGAIDDLVGQLDGLADRFFSGEVRQAVERLAELSVDGGEIEGFSLELRQTVEARAVRAYSGVQDLSGRRDALQELLGDVHELAGNDALRESFNDTERLVRKLLRGAIEIDPRHEADDGDREALRAEDLIDRLLENA